MYWLGLMARLHKKWLLQEAMCKNSAQCATDILSTQLSGQKTADLLKSGGTVTFGSIYNRDTTR